MLKEVVDAYVANNELESPYKGRVFFILYE